MHRTPPVNNKNSKILLVKKARGPYTGLYDLPGGSQENGETYIDTLKREVAEETGIPNSTLANYETGRTEPNIENLGILADFYGVSIDWLVGTKGQNKPK